MRIPCEWPPSLKPLLATETAQQRSIRHADSVRHASVASSLGIVRYEPQENRVIPVEKGVSRVYRLYWERFQKILGASNDRVAKYPVQPTTAWSTAPRNQVCCQKGPSQEREGEGSGNKQAHPVNDNSRWYKSERRWKACLAHFGPK